MTTAALPAPASTGTLSVHRRLPGGGSYTLDALAPGVTTMSIRDADDDLAVLGFDRADVRQLIADLTLVAGLTPTGPTVTRAQAAANAIARLRNNARARALAEQIEAAGKEIARLTECMRIAGLQAFMRDRDPSEVAKHLHDVAKSWVGVERDRDAMRPVVLAAVKGTEAELRAAVDAYLGAK